MLEESEGGLMTSQGSLMTSWRGLKASQREEGLAGGLRVSWRGLILLVASVVYEVL